MALMTSMNLISTDIRGLKLRLEHFARVAKERGAKKKDAKWMHISGKVGDGGGLGFRGSERRG